MALAIRLKSLLQVSATDGHPPQGQLVVGYQGMIPIFAIYMNLNGEPEWFEVIYTRHSDRTEVEYRLIEDHEVFVSCWARIPSVIETESH